MTNRQAALLAGAIASLNEKSRMVYTGGGYDQVDPVLRLAEKYLAWLEKDA